MSFWLGCLDQFVQLILQLLVRLDWLRAIAEQRAKDRLFPDPERSLFLAFQQRFEGNPRVLPKSRHLDSMRLSMMQKQGFGGLALITERFSIGLRTFWVHFGLCCALTSLIS